jgi:hypothetical protein
MKRWGWWAARAFPRRVCGGPTPGAGTHSAIPSSLKRPRAWPYGRRSHLVLCLPRASGSVMAALSIRALIESDPSGVTGRAIAFKVQGPEG